jgi:DNA-binding transcriptional LysR family regulator
MMTMGFEGLNLNRLVVFVAVVEAGSITGAASRLGLGKGVISAHIQQLERELGATLLVRNTRRLRLTEPGEHFFDSARAILEETRIAMEALNQRTGHPKGVMSLSAPVDYSACVLMPVLVKLQQSYPDLIINLINEDRCADLIEEKIDVAIRLSKLSNSCMQAVRVGSFHLWLVANPTFLSTQTNISNPLQLKQLPFISLSVLTNSTNWNFYHAEGNQEQIQFRHSFSVNTAHMAKIAALAGAGITIVPDFAAAEEIKNGRLIHVLPDWTIASKEIFAVFPHSRFIPAKIRVLIDNLKSIST